MDELNYAFGNLEAIAKTQPNGRDILALTEKIKKSMGRKVSETKDMTDKTLFENRAHLLPEEVVRNLQTGDWRTNMFVAYSCKAVGKKTNVKMFTTSDLMQVGVTNLLQGRLKDSEHYFLVTGIRILSYSYPQGEELPGDETELCKQAKYSVVTDSIANGELTLKNGSLVLMEHQPCSIFKHEINNLPFGYVRLENPVIIKPKLDIIADLEFPTMIEANTFLKIELCGLITSIAKN